MAKKLRSILSEKKEDEVDIPDIEYTEEEKVYVGNLQKRLESAKLLREELRDEFDGMNYEQYHRANEKGANAQLRSVKNKGDVDYQSGTLRTKMFSVLSTFQGLNLKPDIMAYTRNEIPINALGNAMEDTLEKAAELENDEEKKMLRQYEMVKQGTVYVEDLWIRRWETTKKLVKEKWVSDKKLNFGKPERSIISGLSVYLGSFSKYFIEDQPYIFTVEEKGYNEVEKIYGKFDNWGKVSKTKKSLPGSSDIGSSMIANAWRLNNSIEDGRVEIIKYQDKSENEFQVILNGVLMLPIGYPLEEVSPGAEYTIVQQNLEPIKYNFAIGKSFIFKYKNKVALLDEMMKLAVRKTQKSLVPPSLNLSAKTVSKDIFLPGAMTRGLAKGDIIPLSDKETEGVTAGEFNMINSLLGAIDRDTQISQTFAGGMEKGDTTATQIMELQRQARIMMGLLNLSAALLEWKLTVKRIPIMIVNWFNPVDDELDKVRNVIQNRYKITSMMMPLEGKGPGMRLTIPREKLPSSDEIHEMEKVMEKEVGMPVKLVFLDPKALKIIRYIWKVNIVPKEKKSSELNKVMFDMMIKSAMGIGLQLEPEYTKERFGEVWEENPMKLFGKGPAPMPPGATPGTPPNATPGGQNKPVANVVPKKEIKIPGSPE